MKFSRIFLTILVCLIGIKIWASSPAHAGKIGSGTGEPYSLGSVQITSNTTGTLPKCYPGVATDGTLYITNTSSGDFVATFQLQGSWGASAPMANIGDEQTVKTADSDTMQYRVTNADNICFQIKAIANHSVANALTYELHMRREGQ